MRAAAAPAAAIVTGTPLVAGASSPGNRAGEVVVRIPLQQGPPEPDDVRICARRADAYCAATVGGPWIAGRSHQGRAVARHHVDDAMSRVHLGIAATGNLRATPAG